jgi:hypothetical protein
MIEEATFSYFAKLQDVNKSRQFFPHLQRVGHCEGVVEFVLSSWRVRVWPLESKAART